MADTIRPLADLQAILLDNASAQISPQDLRDFLVTAVPSGRGATYIVASSGASDLQKAQADDVCSGVSDEVKLQAAIDALPAGGGKLQLTDGTYLLSGPIKLRHGIILEGMGVYSVAAGGAGGTILKLDAGVNLNVIETRDTDGTGEAEQVTMRDFSIDGNSGNNSAGHGIFGQFFKSTVQNVHVEMCAGDGIRFTGAGGGTSSLANKVADCWVRNCASGIHLDGGSTDTIVYGCQVTKCSPNVRLNGFSNHLVANKIYTADGHGIVILNAQRTLIVGNVIATNGFHGIKADDTDLAYDRRFITIVGNRFYRNANGNTNLYDDIILNGTAAGNKFRESIIAANGFYGADDSRYGLNIGANVSDLLVSNNMFAGHATAPILDNSAGGATIRDNLGWATENAGTATIPNASTSVVVTHGLAITPDLQDIAVVLGENPTNDPGNIWVDTITATQFTVNCRNDPGVSGLDFGWQAQML